MTLQIFPSRWWRLTRSAGACASFVCAAAPADSPAPAPSQEEVSGDANVGQAAFAVQKQCADMISADTGRPVMFWRHEGRTRGVSVLPASYGRPIAVLLWTNNETDQPIYTSSCGLADWIEDFSVFDASGHRVLDRDRDYLARAGLDINKVDPDRTAVCTATFIVEIPAKTCIHGQISSPDH